MKKLGNKSFRTTFVESNVRRGLAYQLRAMRKANKNMSQAELGLMLGKPQNVISRLENPQYGKWTIKTLLEIASGFDVAVLVKFVPFSRLVSETENLSQEELAPLSYEGEIALTRVPPIANYQPRGPSLVQPVASPATSIEGVESANLPKLVSRGNQMTDFKVSVIPSDTDPKHFFLPNTELTGMTGVG